MEHLKHKVLGGLQSYLEDRMASRLKKKDLKPGDHHFHDGSMDRPHDGMKSSEEHKLQSHPVKEVLGHTGLVEGSSKEEKMESPATESMEAHDHSGDRQMKEKEELMEREHGLRPDEHEELTRLYEGMDHSGAHGNPENADDENWKNKGKY